MIRKLDLRLHFDVNLRITDEMKRQFEDSHAKIVFCLENNAETVLNALAENNEVTVR